MKFCEKNQSDEEKLIFNFSFCKSVSEMMQKMFFLFLTAKFYHLAVKKGVETEILTKGIVKFNIRVSVSI